uniref:D-aminoacyl-tRNA deacylase n=1 Tax=Candidatus Methanogaster sp. ANME-2c ERB4 TaxID=2759911 RepID=A0A7G9YNP1_9EURY|nr:D-aminoacyl-tRNA deacylase [Methanosarcinales archaeon ANME-2c ERB4]
MNKKTTIVCSAPDPASMNIKENLLAMHDWEREGAVYESDQVRIVEVDKLHIFCDRLDSELERRGLPTDLIIFASKHKSDISKQLFSAHFTGNVSDAKFGGNPRELAPAAPQLLRPVLHSMRDLAADNDAGYEVSMESTHHGPTALSVPSIYIEIGSTEAEWVDRGAGRIVASAILGLDLTLDLQLDLNLDSNSNRDPDGGVRTSGYPVAVGFGGGHYAHRQTKLIFETEITFGHNFPKYQLDNLDDGLIRDALLKSNADFAYFDRKSMNAAQRERISAVIEDLGYEVLRERTIRERFGQ